MKEKIKEAVKMFSVFSAVIILLFATEINLNKKEKAHLKSGLFLSLPRKNYTGYNITVTELTPENIKTALNNTDIPVNFSMEADVFFYNRSNPLTYKIYMKDGILQADVYETERYDFSIIKNEENTYASKSGFDKNLLFPVSAQFFKNYVEKCESFEIIKNENGKFFHLICGKEHLWISTEYSVLFYHEIYDENNNLIYTFKVKNFIPDSA